MVYKKRYGNIKIVRIITQILLIILIFYLVFYFLLNDFSSLPSNTLFSGSAITLLGTNLIGNNMIFNEDFDILHLFQ